MAVWMRHRHEAALGVDPVDRLLGGEITRDGLLEEQPDDLAVPRGNLFADDDPEAIRQIAEPQRALDRVVVRREDDVEPGRLDRQCLHRDRRAAIR